MDDSREHHPAHGHDHAHGHSHGLLDRSIMRSRAGMRAVGVSLVLLAVTAAAQAVVYVTTGSVALLADLVHNVGDAATAIPLAIAFALRSAVAERWAGLAVVFAIFVSACVTGWAAIDHLVHRSDPTGLLALTFAGLLGFVGNQLAAGVRLRAGRRLDSPALIADGQHARIDAWVSMAVVASAALAAVGAPIADPIIGLAMTLVILRITWQSLVIVRSGQLSDAAPASAVPAEFDASDA